ncbi:MAG: vitamin K epoxide reductase family protein [Leptolyngbyaceae cyanobacterium bins.302]|nr:vitamin K epoxide reductase family protein [Leptolyngbyaceae cyanobacterium bins.302]
MPRKRPTPWIHRWSRPIIAGIATIGAVVTAYLTYTKLTGNEAACPTDGCDIVLASPYATVFGLPLALFGFLAYASMVTFAIAPLLISSPKRQDLRAKLESWTGLLLFLGATAMLVFSGYLMYLIAFVIKAVCVYCVASAFFSASLFILTIVGREWKEVGQILFPGIIVATLVLVGTLGVYANVNNPQLAESNSQQLGLEITTTSGEAEIALAKHLAQTGAKFYGAWWCPHCHDQKQLFGKEAAQSLPYIECSTADGSGQTQICQDQKIEGYPTWEINGQRLQSGTKSLEELAQASNYQGSRNFRNTL